MNNLSRAEAYRDQLHDLPNLAPQEEAEIVAMASEIAEREFDKLAKESFRSEWVELHLMDYWNAACDELGLCNGDE